MPDIWTFNRDKALDALSELGAECGVQSRVLDRDPEWTCHINREHPNEAGVIGYDMGKSHRNPEQPLLQRIEWLLRDV